ncbi:DUF4919 domain-containing protein [Paludisphaera soli]|uniref:DUF4919 domain-containing protein n=1 Tax=Paludisphaera soli TaxID=2712865 RepID=UPI0013EC709A|nr:DUF4919 domain-containing protein [Paludisphaera soli]
MILRRRPVALAYAWLCGALITSSALAQEVPEKDAEGRFDEMLAAAKREPGKADWVALRHAFADTARYHPYNGEWKEELAKVRKELRGDDPKAAEAALDELLQREGYMRLDAHGLAAVHYSRTGRRDKEEFHNKFSEGIVDALFASGDGKSFEKPIEVLFIEEEYAFLRALKLEPERQNLVDHEGHKFDVLEVAAAAGGEPLKFYFDIDRPWNSLRKAFQRIKKREIEE